METSDDEEYYNDSHISHRSHHKSHISLRKKCEDPDYVIEQLFYTAYRAKQKAVGMVFGALDTSLTGYYCAFKWGGAGGLVIGGIAQLCGMLVGGVSGFWVGGLNGLASDKYSALQFSKDLRYSIGAGGTPPTHGTFS